MVPLQSGVPGGPELLIVGLFAPVVPSVMVYRVYSDAESHGDDRAASRTLAVGGLLALVVYARQRD